MENTNYYYLNYQGEWPAHLDEELMQTYEALGVEEMSLEEAEVDEILGKASFCGGDLPPDLMDKLEVAQKGLTKKIFFQDFIDAKKAMIQLSLNYPESSIDLITEKNQDWQSNWKQFYNKVDLLDGKITIVPEWEELDTNSELALKIIPGQGFGTGTHETTQLCLEWLLDLKFTNVLDFGCGSGILGIGAQLLNKELNCDYFDIDQCAIDNCLDNLKLNGVLNKFETFLPETKIKLNFKDYDLVFANILAPVLIEEAKFLKSLKSKNLILSGLLEDQINDVMSAYSDKYDIKAVKTRNEWVSILLKLS